MKKLALMTNALVLAALFTFSASPSGYAAASKALDLNTILDITAADDTTPPMTPVDKIPISVNPKCISAGGNHYSDCLANMSRICSTYYSTICPLAYCVFTQPAPGGIVSIPCPAAP